MVRGVFLVAGWSLGRTQLSAWLLIAPVSGVSSLGFFIPRPPEADCGITAFSARKTRSRGA